MTRTNNFLNSQKDIDWLLETHLKSDEDFEWIKSHLRSFILVGNEDAPTILECYSARDPNFGDKPFFTWRRDSIKFPAEKEMKPIQTDIFVSLEKGD